MIELCEKCEKRPVSADCENGFYCSECLQNMAEAYYEQSLGECFRGNEAAAYQAEQWAKRKL